ncbi:hypothetical protein BDF20DRAFT_858205 [Mycotypha africana]|uniref:uncharacterized protein n=1 Tax=Mycotypha africana TaxID=64632 RepID=UPI002301C729|nr:uncharacterized protein BDF20DRAFT_858205 [Mycotypha africana]KAI8984134.1 hypothetical protein BDF20DRAFT_858205 [Mycotypha africana]
MQHQQHDKERQQLPQTSPTLPFEVKKGNNDHYNTDEQSTDTMKRLHFQTIYRHHDTSTEQTNITNIERTKEFTPSRLSFINGHLQHFLKTLLKYLFRDNNLPLWINTIYHLYTARIYIFPYKRTTTGTIRQYEQLTKLQGIHHLSLGLLSLFALKERRLSYERNALFLLTLSSIGRSWSYYQPHSYVRSLKEIGLSNLGITLICAIALVKTIKRTKKFI